MATIDNLDLSIYNLYAIRTKMMEQINTELRLDQASSVATHSQVVDIYPRLAELDILLGIAQSSYAPWAYFFPPKRFKNIRRSPFRFSRVIPSFGSDEEVEAMEVLLRNVSANTEDEQEEKDMMGRCLGKITQINEWMSHIVGRVGQFLQG